MSAIINENYVVAQDSSSGFTSQVIPLVCPYRAINYQFKWDEGVSGKVTFEASIFSDPFQWEQYVNCEGVELNIPADGNGLNHAIVSIIDIWLTVGYLRFVWEPSSGSAGNIDTSIRIVPL